MKRHFFFIIYAIITGLSYMVPIRARRQICYPVEDLGSNRPSDRVLQKQPPYALNHINRKLTFEPKVNKMLYFVN